MNRENIPDDVKSFVVERIPSVSFLEALLQLRASEAGEWNREQLAKKIYVSEDVAEALLNALQSGGFAERIAGPSPTFRYRPQSEELRHKIDKLAATYSRHLVGISRLIHGKGASPAGKCCR
ncbi:MAG TPA: hypothetical protein VJ577_20025 [Burkholderiaceae bacterium]|nr:hypothetical protein [Burkholderiaceae bacterium]